MKNEKKEEYLDKLLDSTISDEDFIDIDSLNIDELDFDGISLDDFEIDEHLNLDSLEDELTIDEHLNELESIVNDINLDMVNKEHKINSNQEDLINHVNSQELFGLDEIKNVESMDTEFDEIKTLDLDEMDFEALDDFVLMDDSEIDEDDQDENDWVESSEVQKEIEAISEDESEIIIQKTSSNFIKNMFGKIFNKNGIKSDEDKKFEDSDGEFDENIKKLAEVDGYPIRAAKKKEKRKKESIPKSKKRKKEKKPKIKEPSEPTKPLPKIPAILLLVFGISIVVLTITITVGFGHSRYVSEAAAYYNDGEYQLAYEQLQGVTLQSDEKELYYKVQVLSWLEKERDSYYDFTKIALYEEALDSLIKGVKRYNEDFEIASELGVISEYQTIEDEIEQLLSTVFDVDVSEAIGLYSLEDKSMYSEKVHKLCQDQGLINE